MKKSTSSVWHVSLAAAALVAAVALGAGLAWAQTATTPPAPAVTPENHAAAVDTFKKARDLFLQEKYPEANAENDKALQLDPSLSDAQTLRRMLQSKVAGGAAAGPATEAANTVSADKVRLLKPSDIALINFKEMTSEDKLKGKIDPKVLHNFWDEVVKKSGASVSADDEKNFLNPTHFDQQLQRFRDADQIAYLEKVEFTNDPAVMLNYKILVEPYVLQNCATAQCHAGNKAGAFRLTRSPGTPTDVVLYTNFYILSMYGDKDGKMIDRDQPDKSLLLQYALPKSVATAIHPKVDIPRHFENPSAPEFQKIVTWIKSLAFPRPNYGIIYEIPTPAPAPPAATQPTTKPATRSATKPAAPIPTK